MKIDGNCNIQEPTLNLTYEDKKIFIQCENSEENTESSKDPGHRNLELKNLTKLDLSYCNVKFLPDCLKMLPLKALNISYNQLNEVPSCVLQGLFSLEELDISYNKIQDFEEVPGCWCKLKSLNLRNNLFKNIPMWIQNASAINLRDFDFSNNTVGNTNEAQYKQIASYNLQKIVFCSSKVTNSNLEFIKSIRTLKHLDLSNEKYVLSNTITSLEKLFIASWYDTLEVLNLNNLNVFFLPENILQIINLKELYLCDNGLFYLPNTIGNLRKLEVLDLSHNHFFTLPKSFEKLSELKILKLHHNQLSKITEIYKLEKLNTLDLYNNELDDFNSNFQVPLIDLEQNFFDASTLINYNEKRNLYRTQNGIVDRCEGPLIEINTELEKDCASYNYASPSDTESDEIEHVKQFVEPESWDDYKIKSNPDVTSSDEEWDGHFEYPAQKKETALKVDSDCYKIFQDCNEE